MSKRRHNFGTKRFKEKSLFIFHARIALKSLILLFVRLIARGARIGKTHTHRQTHRQDKYCNPHACTAWVTVVVLCVCMCVCPLIPAASHIGITKERYQRILCNTGIVLNFADFPKNASFKSYGVICLPRAAPAS